jgi:hypothetical protein
LALIQGIIVESVDATSLAAATSSVPAAALLLHVPDPIEERPAKRACTRKCGEDDLEGRNEIAPILDHSVKMKAIKALHDRVAGNVSSLTKTARVWYQRNVVSTMKCVVKCYGGCIDRFVAEGIPAYHLHKGIAAEVKFSSADYKCNPDVWCKVIDPIT